MLRVRGIWIVLLLCAIEPGFATPHPLSARIVAATQDADQASELRLVYDDVYGFFGGSRFELNQGELVHTHTPRGGRASVETRATLSTQELTDLLALLRVENIWEQRVPDRTPLPDESRAVLTVSMYPARATTWEWYNDLVDNDRLVKVQRTLHALAPAGAP